MAGMAPITHMFAKMSESSLNNDTSSIAVTVPNTPTLLNESQRRGGKVARITGLQRRAARFEQRHQRQQAVVRNQQHLLDAQRDESKRVTETISNTYLARIVSEYEFELRNCVRHLVMIAQLQLRNEQPNGSSI